MKRFAQSHLGILKAIYYVLVFILFVEVIIYCYYRLVNDRTIKYLEGTIHQDGNSSIEFDANEIVIDINVVEPTNKTVPETKPNPPKKTKIVKNTVYRFNYDKDYSKACELEESYKCASSKKLLGYDGSKLYLKYIYVSDDKKTIIGLFEHNIYAYKHLYNDIDNGECASKSFGTYNTKDGVIKLFEKASSGCSGCIDEDNTSNKSYTLKDNIIEDTTNNKKLKLLTTYSDDITSIAYELGYFDGNVVCQKLSDLIK